MKKLSVLLLLMFSFFLSNGAHLVGGEITYTCLGGNNYEIKLRIYRDCNSGGAQFDATVPISIYDASNNLVQNLMVNKGPTISVSTGTGNPCLSSPPNLCTEYAEYITTTSLPPIPGGYVVTHQRCCRNATISNLVNPDDYGNTYTVVIPEIPCNSSPDFTTVPPIVLCLGDNLSIDASAIDPDGDSLFYEFCDILTGGSSGSGGPGVMPNPALAPPYTIIPFATGYSASIPIPGTPPLSIDANTGIISGVATQQGQFVIGICVSEYRNGVLLSNVRRDYQFNVTNCIVNVVADMVTQSEDPTLLCAGTQVQFTPETPGVSSWFWDFGDTTTLSDTSRLFNPVYTFPDTGIYQVTLVVNPGLQCTDTIVETFLVYPPVNLGIDMNGTYCFDVQDYIITATGDLPDDAQLFWTFGDANYPNWQGPNPPPIVWNNPGWNYVTLEMTSGSCPAIAIDSVEIFQWTFPVDAGPDTLITPGTILQITGPPGSAWRWYANRPVYFSNMYGQNPSTITTSDTTTYYVEVTGPDGCRGLDSLVVWMIDTNLLDGDLSNVMNVITPNGDGKNDVFDIREVILSDDCDLIVINRWGKEVYREESYSSSWGGTDFDGNVLPDGTYYYFVRCGIKFKMKGALTIITFEQ